jgi:cell division protease FtsH
MARAKQILAEHAEGHHQIAQLLIEREVITAEDVERILGPRPWKSRGDELLEANAQLAKAEQPKKKRAPRKKKTETANTDNNEKDLA